MLHRVLSDSDDFQAALRASGATGLLVTGRGRFQARLTRLALQHLRMSTIEENLSRIAFIKVPDDKVLFSYLIGDRTSQVWGGVRAGAEDLITVRPGQRVVPRPMVLAIGVQSGSRYENSRGTATP